MPLFSKGYLSNALILILIGAGTYFFVDQLIETIHAGKLKLFLDYMGYLSAPVGVILYFLKAIVQRYNSLQKEIKDFQEETFIQINQLKIMAEFSFRFGQQAADIQNLKEQMKRKNEHE